MAVSSPPKGVSRFGVFELDAHSGELRKSGIRIKLQQQPLQILSALLERPGEVITREELRERLWPGQVYVDFDHGLNKAIGKLRDALGDVADSPHFIETLPKIGYRFLASVETAISADSRGDTSVSLATGSPARKVESRRKWLVATVVAGLLGSAVLAALLLGFSPSRVRNRMRGAGNRPVYAIAVLPLENLSHDPEQEYFADGMTEELITDLSKIEALRVISRTSVMRFKGVSRPLSEIASDLNVDAVIEGSVRRDGDRVRISAQLVGAEPERHLWAGNYEGELRDILALQSNVAQQISREVNVTLTQRDQQRLATTRTVKPEAYEAYLKGVHYLDQANGPEAEKKASAYLQEAIAKDPSYAPAYIELAYFYMLSASGVQAPGESLPNAKLAALKALEIDSSLAEAHAALARAVLLYDHDWRAAETGLRRALELNPASARVHFWLGYMLLPLGRNAEALSEIQRAHELDPLSLDSNLTLGITFFLAGQYDRAIEQYRKTLELDPHYAWPHVYLSWAYEKKGMHATAIAEVQKALAESSNNTQWLANLALAYALAGRRPEARKVMAKLDRLSQREYVSSYDRGFVYVALGEKERAIAALEKAFEEHAERIVWLKVDWRFEPLRSDPRFQDLLRRIHLSP
jgi:TolB-like protein/DNA-binding winged helix-turn-helix (wHTH) protein/lipoprotein NlpI